MTVDRKNKNIKWVVAGVTKHSCVCEMLEINKEILCLIFNYIQNKLYNGVHDTLSSIILISIIITFIFEIE